MAKASEQRRSSPREAKKVATFSCKCKCDSPTIERPKAKASQKKVSVKKAPAKKAIMKKSASKPESNGPLVILNFARDEDIIEIQDLAKKLSRPGESDSTPVIKPGRKSTKAQKQQLQQGVGQQQQHLTTSTPSATPGIQAQAQNMFSSYSQVQSASASVVGGTTTWGNSGMVADPWQNHYHQSMSNPTAAFGAVAVPAAQFSTGFNPAYGSYSHRPNPLNGRQPSSFDVLTSPVMTSVGGAPPPPGAPGTAFVGLNVSMSPRGATSVQGNFQPGYPHRPTEENLLNSSNENSGGHSGNHNRTDTSPDTTTKDLSPPQDGNTTYYLRADSTNSQPSFLACSAGEVPSTTRSTGPLEGSLMEAIATPTLSARSESLDGSSSAPTQKPLNKIEIEMQQTEEQQHETACGSRTMKQKHESESRTVSDEIKNELLFEHEIKTETIAGSIFKDREARNQFNSEDGAYSYADKAPSLEDPMLKDEFLTEEEDDLLGLLMEVSDELPNAIWSHGSPSRDLQVDKVESSDSYNSLRQLRPPNFTSTTDALKNGDADEAISTTKIGESKAEPKCQDQKQNSCHHFLELPLSQVEDSGKTSSETRSGEILLEFKLKETSKTLSEVLDPLYVKITYGEPPKIEPKLNDSKMWNSEIESMFIFDKKPGNRQKIETKRQKERVPKPTRCSTKVSKKRKTKRTQEYISMLLEEFLAKRENENEISGPVQFKLDSSSSIPQFEQVRIDCPTDGKSDQTKNPNFAANQTLLQNIWPDKKTVEQIIDRSCPRPEIKKDPTNFNDDDKPWQSLPDIQWDKAKIERPIKFKDKRKIVASARKELAESAAGLNDCNNNLESLRNNDKEVPPLCSCFEGFDYEYNSGPYYTQLGYAQTFDQLRRMMEERTGVSGQALRMEEAVYCPREGISKTGCPIAKQIVRRSSPNEKFLVIAKERRGHRCSKSWLVIAIISWDGVERDRADELYDKLKYILPEYGIPNERQCEMNTSKTCACQGNDIKKEGASYSFGCAWNVYQDGCKFGKNTTGHVRKFKLAKEGEESDLEDEMDDLADEMGILLEKVAPDAFSNLTAFSKEAEFCRIGTGPKDKKPFSGVTSVVDFCAHSHHDRNNIHAGCTMVVTLTRPENRALGVLRRDEQFHVLPNYRVKNSPAISPVAPKGLQILQEYRCMYGTRKAPRKKHKCSKNNKYIQKWGAPNKKDGGESTTTKIGLKQVKPFKAPKLPKMPKLVRINKSGRKKVKFTKEFLDFFRSKMNQMSSSGDETYSDKQHQFYSGYQLTPPVAKNYSQQNSHYPGNNMNGYPNQKSSYQTFGLANSQDDPVTMQPQFGQYLPGQGRFEPYNQKVATTNLPSTPSNNFSSGQSIKQTNQMLNAQYQTVQGSVALPQFGYFNNYIPQLDGADDNDLSNASYHLMPQKQFQNSSLSSLVLPITDFCEKSLDCLVQASTPGSFISQAISNARGFQPQPARHFQSTDSTESRRTCLTPAPSQNFGFPPTPISLANSPMHNNNHTSSEKESTSDEDIITYQEVNNCEVFGERNIDIGGLALALEHGSVLIECAKHEMHATTALKNPDRFNPTRIGLVFYQHKRLCFAQHGYFKLKQKAAEKMERDYEKYLIGKFVPSVRQLVAMTDAGYQFPEKVTVAPSKKPRTNGGLEIEDNLADPSNQYYIVDNPAYNKNITPKDLVNLIKSGCAPKASMASNLKNSSINDSNINASMNASSSNAELNQLGVDCNTSNNVNSVNLVSSLNNESKNVIRSDNLNVNSSPTTCSVPNPVSLTKPVFAPNSTHAISSNFGSQNSANTMKVPEAANHVSTASLTKPMLAPNTTQGVSANLCFQNSANNMRAADTASLTKHMRDPNIPHTFSANFSSQNFVNNMRATDTSSHVSTATLAKPMRASFTPHTVSANYSSQNSANTVRAADTASHVSTAILTKPMFAPNATQTVSANFCSQNSANTIRVPDTTSHVSTTSCSSSNRTFGPMNAIYHQTVTSSNLKPETPSVINESYNKTGQTIKSNPNDSFFKLTPAHQANAYGFMHAIYNPPIHKNVASSSNLVTPTIQNSLSRIINTNDSVFKSIPTNPANAFLLNRAIYSPSSSSDLKSENPNGNQTIQNGSSPMYRPTSSSNVKMTPTYKIQNPTDFHFYDPYPVAKTTNQQNFVPQKQILAKEEFQGSNLNQIGHFNFYNQHTN